MNANLFARIEEGADPAAVFIDTVDGRRLTYGDVLALSARLANALGARGVEVGDRVAVQVDKTPEALVLYLACIRAGAVYLPLNPAFTPAELAYFIGDAEPKLIVCDPGRRADIADIAGGAAIDTLDAAGQGSLIDRAAAQTEAFPTVERDGGDLAAILYTSGTTGRAKGAMLTHDNLASNADTLVKAWRFTRDDVLIHALPIHHTHGLFVATNTVLLAGGAMLLLPKFDAGAIIRAMPRASALMGVPTFYTRLLAHADLNREAAANMRLFVSGSAPLLAETHRAFRERTGHAILERYGMTETAPLADGEVGMIEVRGPNVFKGYWRMPDKTAAEFRDGFFVTGDLGLIDGGYVTIVGRARDLVISGGENVYPREVEGEIDALPGVVESAVIGAPHADLGEAVVAVVVAEAGQVIDEATILARLHDRLAGFKRPKRVMLVDELPRNAMGKVQKNVLRERYKGLFEEP